MLNVLTSWKCFETLRKYRRGTFRNIFCNSPLKGWRSHLSFEHQRENSNKITTNKTLGAKIERRSLGHHGAAVRNTTAADARDQKTKRLIRSEQRVMSDRRCVCGEAPAVTSALLGGRTRNAKARGPDTRGRLPPELWQARVGRSSAPEWGPRPATRETKDSGSARLSDTSCQLFGRVRNRVWCSERLLKVSTLSGNLLSGEGMYWRIIRAEIRKRHRYRFVVCFFIVSKFVQYINTLIPVVNSSMIITIILYCPTLT